MNDQRQGADSLYGIRSGIEDEGARLDALQGLVSLLGNAQHAADETPLGDAFYVIAEVIERRKDALGALASRLAIFEAADGRQP